jgi:membrane-bound ClpP family serine protease
MDNDHIDRRETAAMLLSTTGAAIAGAGFGLIFSRLLQPYGAAVLIVGIVAHLVGMISRRRAQSSQNYVRAAWEVASYWICWSLIILLLGYIAFGLVT